MEYEQWLDILSTINADNDLNESNVIGKIKEKLEKEDQGTYKEWRNNQFDINYTCNDQLTLLHIVAANGLAKVTEFLIKKGVEVDKANQYGCTPLHFAAENGHTEIVKILIEKGANVDAMDEDEFTPLFSAAAQGHTEIVKVLIEKGANVDAVKKSGWSPLHLAAQNGHTETVNALIEKGVNVDAVNISGWSPLHLAAQNGHTETVNALIGKGANVDVVDKSGQSPLHFAVKANESGRWVGLLSCALKNRPTEVVNALIEKGVNVNAVDKDKFTPLHFAAQNGLTEIVNALIEKGANVDAVDKSGRSPLNYAVESGHVEIVEALKKKRANPLLGDKSYGTFKRFTELIKNNSLEHPPGKKEETQQRGEQVDDEYGLLRYSLLFRNGCSLIDTVGRDTFDNLVCKWFVDVSGLTKEQNKLNKKLLSILIKDLPYFSGEGTLRDFLLGNNSDDLKYILDLKRGESGLTILHVISNMGGRFERYVNFLLEAGANPNVEDDRGRTPLHYASCNNIESLLKAKANLNVQDSEGKTPLHCAASIGDAEKVGVLLKHRADSSIKDKQGKIPLQVAHDYHIEEYFFTNKQIMLWLELSTIHGDSLSSCLAKLKKFLSKHKNTKDFESFLSLHDDEGKSRIFQFIRRVFRDCETSCKEAEELLLKAGAIDYKGLDRKEYLPKSGTLWDNVISHQQQKLKMFLDLVGKAQNMNKLEQIVNKAIESGVRFNFLVCPGEMMYQDTYNFTDYVIKRISELEKNPKVASDIICKLVSKGAVLHNLSSIDVIDTLESEFKDHKTNMKKAHEGYVNNNLEFMKIVKSAATGRVKNAKMDNTTFYLEYSEDSKIDVAKITDGARDLGLTQGEIEYGRDIIRIGKSEVEIITQKGIRHYTDLADGSDIVLTFSTSEGELEVNLSPDKKDKDKIIVEVSNKKEILEKFKDCKEELGKNCSLGRYLVYNAIEQGYFKRSGKLMRSEAMSQSNGKIGPLTKFDEIRGVSSFKETVSRCI